MKRIIQSSARNSILGIYGRIQLNANPVSNIGLIQFSAIPGIKALSCSSQQWCSQNRVVARAQVGQHIECVEARSFRGLGGLHPRENFGI